MDFRVRFELVLIFKFIYCKRILCQLNWTGHIAHRRVVMETWSSHNVEPWALNWKIRSSERYNLVISVRELLLWEQLQKRKWCELSLSENITSYRGREKEKQCARETIVTVLRGPDGCEIYSIYQINIG